MDYLISTLDQVRPLLVNFRKKAGLSQAAVAARLGISQQAYARMEAHPTDASVTRLFTVLQLLGATVAFGHTTPAATGRIKEVPAHPLPARRRAVVAENPSTGD
ncbi:helix-turn-helix domain-containing protein [Pseudoduganella buxea]|uniref:Helix-turn-helix domain-containing protein n=1 Tax=Pseudoduganella buxea TaxID=1949069 RepID=A0A6I3SWK9_9BURK|nr:helix-turn-helix transcriptional regulator [Pseudoduganella buxea]MTV53424.1 helix-turn-helix domain-containing protein [Pseudoduganella buxea]GGC19748.1 hypothetical protein GCM10011572_46430 [Pseudoduganella buxea]